MTAEAAAGMWSRVTAFLSEAVVLTALLYYFGWVRAQAGFGHYGVDLSLLELSTADYVLRSVNSAFPPLVVLGVALVGLGALHRVVAARGGLALRVLLRSARVVGAVGLTLAGSGVVMAHPVGKWLGIALPLALSVGAGALLYADRLAREEPVAGVRVLALTALTAIGVVWAITLHAQRTGQDAARAFAADLPAHPEVVLYSGQRLAIAGPGVAVDPIAQEDSRFRFRYRGLRMVIHTRDRYLLVAAGWRRGHDPLHVVRAADDVRIDMTTRG